MHIVRIVAVLTLALVAPLQAYAMAVSLSPATIQSFTQINSTGSPSTFTTSAPAAGAGFTTVWGFTVVGANSADVGATGLNLDWSGSDTFLLNVANDNENTWSFSVSVSDGTNTVTSTSQALPNNSLPSLFSVDITSLNVASIDSVYVTVGAILPINGFDRTAEYAITTVVPVPAAVWLFGSCLGLLGFIRRKSA